MAASAKTAEIDFHLPTAFFVRVFRENDMCICVFLPAIEPPAISRVSGNSQFLILPQLFPSKYLHWLADGRYQCGAPNTLKTLAEAGTILR